MTHQANALLPGLKPLKPDPWNPRGERRMDPCKFSFGLPTHAITSKCACVSERARTCAHTHIHTVS